MGKDEMRVIRGACDSLSPIHSRAPHFLRARREE